MMRKIRSGFLFGGIVFAVTLSASAASGEFTRLKFNTPGTTFLKGGLGTWPMIMEVFYGAIRGFDYHFFPKTEETLENLADDDYDWSGEEESEKDNE